MTATEDADVLAADVLIVGGGLAGLPLAIACAQAGVAVAMVEKSAPALIQAEGFDSRTTAVALGAQRVLGAIGVWPLVEAVAGPILDIRVMDQGCAPFVHYDHRAAGSEPMGWIVENRHLRAALDTVAQSLPGLTIRAPAEIIALTRAQSGVVATLATGERIVARLAVAADGKNSPTRQAAGLKTIGWPYDQVSVVAIIAHERPHDGVAVENFFPDVPFAMLPMTTDATVGHRTSIVWSTTRARAAELMACDDASFTRAVAQRVGDWLGAVSLAAPRASFPVSLFVTPTLIGERLALVGEAGHVVHPIAGQGLNLGLRDVATLAELIVDTCRLGLDPGSADMLRRYDRRRRPDVLRLAGTTDGLYRLFATDFPPVAAARRAGLAVFDQVGPLKRAAMRQAMGVAGDPLRLVRGEAL